MRKSLSAKCQKRTSRRAAADGVYAIFPIAVSMWLHLGHEVVMKTPLPQARVVLRPSNIDACPPLPHEFPF